MRNINLLIIGIQITCLSLCVAPNAAFAYENDEIPLSEEINLDSLLDADYRETFKAMLKADIGLRLFLKNNKVSVLGTYPESPSEKTGLLAGDEIISINGSSVNKFEFKDIQYLLLGHEGTEVIIEVNRKGRKLEFVIPRSIQKYEDVYVEYREKIPVITFTQITDDAAKEFNSFIEKINRAKFSSVIIDLRGCPGGYANAVLHVASAFVPNNTTIFHTKGDSLLEFLNTTREQIVIRDMKIFVLVDEGTAAGAEVLAEALKHYKGAIIIGRKTYGAGEMQQLTTYADGSSVLETIGMMYFSNGKPVIEGLKPDVIVNYSSRVDLPMKRAIVLAKKNSKK